MIKKSDPASAMKTPVKSTTIEDPGTGQYFPAIEYSDGTKETFSPTSFDEIRALKIADDLLEDIKRRSLEQP